CVTSTELLLVVPSSKPFATSRFWKTTPLSCDFSPVPRSIVPLNVPLEEKLIFRLPSASVTLFPGPNETELVTGVGRSPSERTRLPEVRFRPEPPALTYVEPIASYWRVKPAE